MRTHEIINATGFYNQNASDIGLLPSVFFGVLVLDTLIFSYRVDPASDGFDISVWIVNKDERVQDVSVMMAGEMEARLRDDTFWLLHRNTVTEAMKFITLDGLFPLVAWVPSGSAGR